MNESQTITVRVSQELANKFAELCLKQRRSKTEVLRMLIEEACKPGAKYQYKLAEEL